MHSESIVENVEKQQCLYELYDHIDAASDLVEPYPELHPVQFLLWNAWENAQRLMQAS